MTTVQISERALIQRINRRLRSANQITKASRGNVRQKLGRFFVLDLRKKEVMRRDVDLELLGRKLRVLGPWESVAVDPTSLTKRKVK